ncbi:MAG: efflux RND transporter permease subunit [Gemmatimonadales bacterium]|nr:efflux RND transporter permease subunit [Gemmatimonadales bacterium]
MGIAGRVARAFLHAKLTPLVTVASLAVGALALVATPREEEPQISVPMLDVLLALPGAPPEDVEALLTRPLEQRMWEIPGVEHVYSMSADGQALVTVRFAVGEDQERSVTKVQAKLAQDAFRLPPGALPPVLQPHAIDDVPILALTLHGGGLGAGELRRVGLLLAEELRALPAVADVQVLGGPSRQARVQLDPARLAAAGVAAGEVAAALRGATARAQAGAFSAADHEMTVRVGGDAATVGALGAVVVATRGGVPVAVRDVATVTVEDAEPVDHVLHATTGGRVERAVTVALAKRPGANATHVADAALARVAEARGRLLPAGLEVTVTRNYGETAAGKAGELMLHLAIATLSVTALVALALGWQEAVVVLVAVPVTLALTLFAYYALGYSLNRITLFALIFSIGILVDDAIVVVENIYRHMAMDGATPDAAAVSGVDEVGNPTILATFTVIAAILPMAFVRGLMGPYMRPIPVGASVAMLASLAVAFIVTPWAALRLLRGHAGGGGHGAPARPDRFARWYAPFMRRLMAGAGRRRAFYGGVGALLVASLALVAVRLVQVKMLPFDDKSEFQVVLDFPEGTTLETATAAASAVAARLREVPEVTGTQVYAGTAAPANFNGLVRHYFLRRGPTVADVQVALRPRHERTRQSHAIAVAARPLVDAVARTYGASAKVAEIPPGPPVLSTLVAEVYAPSEAARVEAARRVRAVFDRAEGVVDVDWTEEAAPPELRLVVDRARATADGASVEQVVQTVALASRGMPVAVLPAAGAREPLAVVPRLAVAERSRAEALLALTVLTPAGLQPVDRYVRADTVPRPAARFRKDLRPVTYVTADVAGAVEAPVYAILAMNRALDSVRVGGAPLARYNAVQPERVDEVAMKWDGEWQVTIEVFRDLGLAFAVVLVLIYVLVVGWFQSFSVPLVIMAPIPLTLVGILPGHAVSGAFFTATSMIGMIALAGIIVRNSILLVDFIQLAEARGVPLAEAVIEAGSVRFRPIALTAAAVVVGGLVMVLDPIFQGLAVALISGAVVATGLTMVVVPLLYWELRRRQADVS